MMHMFKIDSARTINLDQVVMVIHPISDMQPDVRLIMANGMTLLLRPYQWEFMRGEIHITEIEPRDDGSEQLSLPFEEM